MKKTILFALVLVLCMVSEVANADYTFGDVEPLPEPINTPGISSADFTMTADGLEAYFVSIDRPGGYGREDIWVCRRESPEDCWGPAVNLGPPVNTLTSDGTPCISADGLELYFSNVGPSGSTYRPGEQGGGDIWVTRRANRDDDWAAPFNLGPTINSSSMETYPNISADGLSLYFSRRGDIYVATRLTKDDDWGSPVRVTGGVNSSSWDGFPNISSDQRVLFFYSARSGGYGGMDMYMSMRPTVSDAWGPAINLGPKINTQYYDVAPSLSSDGCILHLTRNDASDWSGNFKIYRAKINPVVDLNGDGIVDAADVCIMVDNWGTDEPLCDIGPMPWGDGVVDVQDLVVIAENLFTYPSTVAHWELDETEGDTAYDSAGDCDGTLAGGPVWQPDGGMVAGAIQLDGIDDYVSTEFVLNPADGAFSVFAWIKGGAPGQPIISQTDDFNWLCVDASEGNLMTELRYISRGGSGTPLVSQTPITDDLWHRVGLSWDGTNRILYVDDVEVAKDTQPGLVSLGGGLYIGAGKNPEEGTFWSGLIDDIRIYNRAVSP